MKMHDSVIKPPAGFRMVMFSAGAAAGAAKQNARSARYRLCTLVPDWATS